MRQAMLRSKVKAKLMTRMTRENGEQQRNDQKQSNKNQKKQPKKGVYSNENQNKEKSNEKNNDKKGSVQTSETNNTPLAPVIPASQPKQTSDINYDGKGDTITVLHVAEKPGIAQAIAKGLAKGNFDSRRSKSLPVHEFTGPPFPKAPHASKCNHRVTSVAGHVF
jgi:hypothetical protein